MTATQILPVTLTLKAAAAHTGLSVRTLQRAIARGQLTLRKVGGRSLLARTEVEAIVLGRSDANQVEAA